jgi:EAL domain-containing protein (putative c-di-GMP-specific phosphodiesterase class I)
LAALMQMGCKFGQGFLFARAQPAKTWIKAEA